MSKKLTIVLAFVTAAAQVACLGPRRSGRDTTAPLVKITVVDSHPAQTFGTDEGRLEGACAKVRSFPTTITVTATDSGGIGSVWVRSFPGRIRNVKVAPPPPETQVGMTPGPSGDLLSARFPRRSDRQVQVSAVLTVDVTELSALRAGATDLSGNANEVGQIDVRPLGDPVVCRGETPSTK